MAARITDGEVEREPRERLLFEEEVFRIQGAIIEVNAQMGSGFLEAVYQECLVIELTARGVPFVANALLPLEYRGHRLRQSYRADFVCYGKIILELKAMSALLPEHRLQVLNYLRATDLQLGLL